MNDITSSKSADRRLGTWDIFVAGIALVVAASTMVSEFSGYFQIGLGFVISLLIGFAINLSLAFSAADLSATLPKAGALYDYARMVLPSHWGRGVGTFLGLTFFGMSAFAAAGETTAGANGLKALLGVDISIEWFIVACSVLAIIPNLLGLKATAWVSAGLLVAMLSIRWFFGLAGFLNWGATGSWALTNLIPAESVGWFSEHGVIRSGLALAIWSFVGIEFACSLAEEVRQPRRTMPRGLVLGLIIVLATSLVMGLGVGGIMPLTTWRELAAGEMGAGGDAPQLVVGYTMFGSVGYHLMALASFIATLSSLTIFYAAMPLLIQRLAADRCLFGPFSQLLAETHPRTRTPKRAILATVAIFIVPALLSTAVVDWVYSAAYVWLLLYIAFHVLAVYRRLWGENSISGLPRKSIIANGLLGIAATAAAIALSFSGSHLAYGGRALVVLLAAAIVTKLSSRRSEYTGWAAAFRLGARTETAS